MHAGSFFSLQSIQSIMYRMRLPMVIVFNKVDIQDCSTIEDWMRDYEVGFPVSTFD